jgi:hypothetical protein
MNRLPSQLDKEPSTKRTVKRTVLAFIHHVTLSRNQKLMTMPTTKSLNITSKSPGKRRPSGVKDINGVKENQRHLVFEHEISQLKAMVRGGREIIHRYLYRHNSLEGFNPYIAGAGMLFNIPGNRFSPIKPSGLSRDTQALAEDWKLVGEDLWGAISREK